jgi:hypothetical protein
MVTSRTRVITAFLEEAHVLVAQLLRLFGWQCITGDDQEIH